MTSCTIQKKICTVCFLSREDEKIMEGSTEKILPNTPTTTSIASGTQSKPKDGLIKMLLQSSTASITSSTTTTSTPSTTPAPTPSSKSRWSEAAIPSPRELAAKMPPIDIVEENTALFVHQISSKEKIYLIEDHLFN